jgi:hypothetical protein
MKTEDILKELWSLANIVTGFSVAQSLAFAVALGKDLAGLQSQIMCVKVVLTIFCIVFGCAYSFAVWRCHRLAMSVDNVHSNVWLQVTRGRIFCIWLFGIVPVFGLFAPNIFSK